MSLQLSLFLGRIKMHKCHIRFLMISHFEAIQGGLLNLTPKEIRLRPYISSQSRSLFLHSICKICVNANSGDKCLTKEKFEWLVWRGIFAMWNFAKSFPDMPPSSSHFSSKWYSLNLMKDDKIVYRTSQIIMF